MDRDPKRVAENSLQLADFSGQGYVLDKRLENLIIVAACDPTVAEVCLVVRSTDHTITRAQTACMLGIHSRGPYCCASGKRRNSKAKAQRTEKVRS